jgi:hypothetical protein
VSEILPSICTVASDGGTPAFKSYIADKHYNKDGKKGSIEDGREAQRARASETSLGAMLGSSATDEQIASLADQTPALKKGKGPGSDETLRTLIGIQSTSRMLELSIALETHLFEDEAEHQELRDEMRRLIQNKKSTRK